MPFKRFPCLLCILYIVTIALTVYGPKDFLGAKKAIETADRFLNDGQQCSIAGRIYHKEIKNDKPVYYLKNATIQTDSVRLKNISLILYSDSDTIPNESFITAKGSISLFSNARNEGNFDLKKYYNSLGFVTMVKGSSIDSVNVPVAFSKDLLYRFTKAVESVFKAELPGEEAGFLSSVTMGDKALLEPDLKELFQNVGIAHILAVSGLHISFLCMGIYKLLRKMRKSFLVSATVSGIFSIIYLFLTGMSVSAFRAVGMFLIYLLAEVAGEAYDRLTALLLMAVILLSKNPLYIINSGFTFSFGAVLSVEFVAAPLKTQFDEFLENRREKLACIKGVQALHQKTFLEIVAEKIGASLVFSAAITIGCLPLTVLLFYQFPTYSILLNFLIIPLMPALLGLGLTGGIFGLVNMKIASVFLFPCHLIIYSIEFLADFVSDLPGALVITGRPTFFLVCVYYLCLLLLINLNLDTLLLQKEGGNFYETNCLTSQRKTYETNHLTDPQKTYETNYLTGPRETYETNCLTGPRKTYETNYLTGPRKTYETNYLTGPRKTYETNYLTGPRETSETNHLTGPRETFETNHLTGPRETSETNHLTGPRETYETNSLTGPRKTYETNHLTGPMKTYKTNFLSSHRKNYGINYWFSPRKIYKPYFLSRLQKNKKKRTAKKLVEFVIYKLCSKIFNLLDSSGMRLILKLALGLLLSLLFIVHRPIGFEVDVLDVGQGDGTFISGGSGDYYFIDGGSTSEDQVGKYRILPFLKYNGISKIDYWFLSHSDQDHISGLIEAMNKDYQIENIVIPSALREDETMKEIENFAKDKGTRVLFMKEGDIVSGKNIGFSCIYPGECAGTIDDVNDYSLCLFMKYQDGDAEFSGFFGGDISSEIENKLDSAGKLENIDFLKVSHHGSRYSSDSDFLATLKPSVSTISCAENNNYGHPADEAIERLQAVGTKIYYTMKSGQIKIQVRSGSIILVKLMLVNIKTNIGTW